MNDDAAVPPRATTAALHKLARSHLASPKARFPPQTRGPWMREALTAAGYGLEHLRGEHVVACLDHGEGEGFAGLIVTDRAVVVALAEQRLVVPWSELTGATLEEGWLSTTLEVQTRGGVAQELALTQDADKVRGFLQAVVEARYAPAERRAPLLACAADDPAGLAQLVGSLQQPAPAIVTLLGAAHDALTAGRPAAEVREGAARVALHHRALAFGRGAAGGRWLSPLSPAAFEAAAAALLPPGAARQVLKGGAVALEVRLGDADPEEEEDAAPSGGGLQERIAGAKAALQDRITGAVVENVVDRLANKVLGEDLATFLGEEATGLRIVFQPGPQLADLIDDAPAEPAAAAPSAWSKLKTSLSELTQAFAAPAASAATLTAYQIEARLGRRWRPLAEADLPRLIDLHQRLLDAESRALLQSFA